MKRSNPAAEGEASCTKRRQVSYSTFRKWRTDLDKDCQTISWLECDKTSGGTVSKLKCGVCVKFQSSIERRRNYSDKWISGADSVRTSNIRDHAKTDQHKHAMMLLKKSMRFRKEKVPLLMLRSLDSYMSSQRMLLLSFESNLT